jgi:hypothetical protein
VIESQTSMKSKVGRNGDRVTRGWRDKEMRKRGR